MKSIHLYFTVLILACFSCQQDDLVIDNGEKDEDNTLDPISVTKDGYLRFDSQTTFDDYINSFREDADPTTRSASVKSIPGFISIKKLKDIIEEQNATRSMSEDDEEGSEEEYKLACIEELIPDELLSNVLDTTLRIVIQDKFYKITPKGTFYVDRNRAGEIDEIIAGYDASSLSAVGDELYLVKDGVYLYDTFGTISGNNSIDNIVMEEEEDYADESISTRSLTLGDESKNTTTYGLKTYKWTFQWSVSGYFEAYKTFFGLFGKDINRENNFDKKHRVQCNLFQTNYVYYATTGIKVKMQKRKKILFVTYWVGAKAEDIAIGVEELQGKATFEYNMNVVRDYGQYVRIYLGQVNNMVYGGLGKPTFVEDWLKTNVADVYFPGLKTFDFGKFKVDPWSWTKGLTKDCIFYGLRAMEGELITAPIRKHVKAADPKMALHFNGNGSQITSYIAGIQSYGARESKTVRFSQAGGFSISVGGSPIGYLPEKFTIESTRIFGAVKYNGVWKGVRFYKNK